MSDGLGKRPLTENEREELFEQFKALDGRAFSFIVSRVALDLTDESHRGQTSFSAEAMDNLGIQMMLFIGSRILRHRDRTGDMPQRMQVTLTVDPS